MIADLEFIRNAFEVKYALNQWKNRHAGWDLNREFQLAKGKVLQLKEPTLKDFRFILRDFFKSARDYHVGIHFYATESAHLPFTVKGAQGRYFISSIDRKRLPHQAFPFQIGDEILYFDGRPIHEEVTRLQFSELGSNLEGTDRALATEILLTCRKASKGNEVPFGPISLICNHRETKEDETVVLEWSHVPEMIRDFAHLGKFRPHAASSFDLISNRKRHHHLMISSFCEVSSSTHPIELKEGFHASFGIKLWESHEAACPSCLYLGPSGIKIGYLRIPDFLGEFEQAAEFGKIVSVLEQDADVLVIDLCNNPGGYLAQVYAMSSMLTDIPLRTAKHRIVLSQAEVQLALDILFAIHSKELDHLKEVDYLEGFIHGFPDDELIKSIQSFCYFIIDQWNEGNLISDPVHLLGIESIQPHPIYRFTKPILILMDHLSFSAAEFFSAMMADNKKALIFGEQSAGAGGLVLEEFDFPNHSGIKKFQLTASLAELGEQYLENRGIEPDIPYEVTTEDLQCNYQNYIASILEVVEKLSAQ